MKLTKTASGKQTIKISKSEWQSIGKTAGWSDDANTEKKYIDGEPVYIFPNGGNIAANIISLADGWHEGDEGYGDWYDVVNVYGETGPVHVKNISRSRDRKPSTPSI